MDLKNLFREKTNALAISDYAQIQSNNGGAPWGDSDPASRSVFIPLRRRVVNLSAAYTFTPYDTSYFFTIDTAITVTLPAASAALVGIYYELMVIADVTVVVAATNASELIMFNDTAANSFTWSTSSEKVGASCKALCVSATKWAIQLMTEETQTTTVTT